MRSTMLNIILIDEGMNPGSTRGSRIGGGQVARKRFFSNKKYFDVTVLTSEPEIIELWSDCASVKYLSGLRTYRPTRFHIPRNVTKLLLLLKDAFKAMTVMSREVNNSNQDVIFINDNKSRFLYILGLFFMKFSAFKGLTAIEVDGEWSFRPFDFCMKLLFLTFFDRIICPAEAIKSQLGIIGKLYDRKLIVAYPGVNIPKITYQKGCHTNKLKKRIFGCIGILRLEIKGQDIIIRAVDTLIKSKYEFPIEIRFYGDGPDFTILEDMITQTGLENYFRFCGCVKDQEKIFNEIDACIIASRTEAASLVLMECLVRNIPVIIPDLEGCIEIIKPFYSGLTFKAGDPESLAVIMKKALRNNLLTKIRNNLIDSNKELITLDYQVQRVYEFLKMDLSTKKLRS